MDTINPRQVADTLVSFLQTSFEKEKVKNAVIGLSGGVDSATSAALAVRALGAVSVYPVLLPYGNLNDQGKADAQIVIDALQIPHGNAQIVDIQPMVDAVVASLDPIMDAEARGRIMARMRMVCLFDIAKSRNALVVGTENKSEHLLGYYTQFGDEASDIEPIRNLYKTQVYALARFLGVPEPVLRKAPTAGLWAGQTDEGQFGFMYKEADEILWLLAEKGMSGKELEKRFARALVARVWWWVEKGRLKDRLPMLP